MQKIRPDLDIGSTIRSLRRKSGLSQDDVVRELSLLGLTISRSTYAKLETNRMNIRVSELKALTLTFHCDYNAFFEEV